ncbi:hypothetical protein [Streptomyces sp. NBC_00859]|uniref:hypothetical protein n=1 Tax=Streptomyces sp. NBC_00859 TaxID=2903682 RepID=UPI0038656EB5|nr:hypothetical protein OG584_06990 [Streptomyces sp. NBC_00859]
MNHRLPVLVAAALAVPVLTVTGCSHSSQPDGAAPAAGHGSPAPARDQLPEMQKKVDAAQHAADSADANADADNSGD